MKNKKAIVGSLLATTALLAAMGCWFCWHCPSRFYGAHELFWRQLAWNGVGLAVFAGTWAVGWRRLLKAAPWLMAAWVAAFVMARFSRPIGGAHEWISAGPVSVNVVTCFMPVFALFVAWLHEKKWIRSWMEWTAVALAATWMVWMMSRSVRWQARLDAFFNPGEWMKGTAYMARQLQMAFDASNWFGCAGRDLGYLPCASSDGMMSASALLFGKWFPSVVIMAFALIGLLLTWILRCSGEASRRRFTLLFGLWLVVPAAYCLFQSLALLPVMGKSPALVSYGGSATAMAWFGMGVLAAMAMGSSSEQRSDIRMWRIVAVWGAMALLSVVAIAVAPGRECWAPRCRFDFAEPRPSDLSFGEFGLTAKRGRILAADGSPLAHTVRAWRFYLDPFAADTSVYKAEHIRGIAEGLGVPAKDLLEAYARVDNAFPLCCEAAHDLGISMESLLDANKQKDTIAKSPRRYIFLAEVADDSPALAYFGKNDHWLTKRAGLIREPVQKRVYPLGSAAVQVVGFMIGGAHTDTPVGAGGIESACNKSLAGANGAYDKKLPVKERHEKAIPKPGADVQTTLVPTLQKSVAEALAAACATNGAESAWGLVMKIPSGEIEAMASWPTFDPSMRRDLGKWNDSMAANRATQLLFEPGGLAKPLTYAIALDEGVLTVDAELDQGDGTWEYNGVTLKDEATNTLSIAEAIERRVNIAAGKTACLIGPEKFHAALRRFGFGRKTRTAGIPGEESGIIVSKPERWDKTTAMRVGMGYGFAATGLQIAQAYATLANHGTLVRPVLLAGAAHSCATNESTQVVSPAAADAIVRMLKTPMPSTVQISEHDKESGRPFYSPTNYIASCAGFYPADRPQYVIVVSFVKPRTAHTGDEVARPVFDLIANVLAVRR